MLSDFTEISLFLIFETINCVLKCKHLMHSKPETHCVIIDVCSDLYGTFTAVTVFTGPVSYHPRYLTQYGRNCNPTITQNRHQISSTGGIPLIYHVHQI